MSISLQQKPCYEVACDRCGEGDNYDYGGSFHHPDEATARESMEGSDWLVREDGVALCNSCLDSVEDLIACPECEAPKGSRCADPDGGRAFDACHERKVAALAALASSEGQS